MLKPLDVSPEHLNTTGTGLSAALAAASTAITAASSLIVPAPAGADDVSAFVAGAFSGFAGVIGTALSGGLGIAQAGAQAFAPVAANYQSTDAGAHRTEAA